MAWVRATIDDCWLTTAEAAEVLGMSPARLCRLRRRGHLPPGMSAKFMRSMIVWAAEEVDRWSARGRP